MLAKLAPAFRHWIDHAKNIALLGAVGAGCVYGYAYAIAPTVDTDRNFAGSITLIRDNQPSNSIVPVYTVPAGQQYTLTDIIVSNTNSTISYIQMFVASEPSCGIVTARTHRITVPPLGSLHIPLQTGVGAGAGKTFCVAVGLVSSWSLRGYLSNEG